MMCSSPWMMFLLACAGPGKVDDAGTDDTGAADTADPDTGDTGETGDTDTADTGDTDTADTGDATPDPDDDPAVVFGYTFGRDRGWLWPTAHLLGPDFDGDGTADLVVAQAGYSTPASAGACDGPGVYVIPGGTRSETRVPITSASRLHIDPGNCFGAALATAPDLDGDGIDELLVTEPSLVGQDLEADVYVVGSRVIAAGSTTTEMATTFVDASRVARQGDLDGDGVDDLVLAGHEGWWTVSGATIPAGTVEAPTGQVPAEEAQRYGSTGDLDGDGLAEVAIVTSRGTIAVVSPTDGTEPWVEIVDGVFAPPEGIDADGDGYREIVTEAGAVYLLSVHDRVGTIGPMEATTVVAPVGIEVTDFVVTDDVLVVSGRTAGDAESVQAVIDGADLGPGSFDLSVARGCVRTPGYLGPSVVAGAYLGDGTLQVALGGADLGGYVLDLGDLSESCD